MNRTIFFSIHPARLKNGTQVYAESADCVYLYGSEHMRDGLNND